ncbi:MAG: hypothetical protein JRN29_04940, partial [Nitrososphaerota archaeon]|nr:hypothetical protein [Nitrososphaerota archaeon]
MESTLRQPIVVVLGHVDAGKCVGPDVMLETADGRLLRAHDAFEGYRKGPRLPHPEEVYAARGLRLLSLSPDGRLSGAKVTHVWRRTSPAALRVRTDAGLDIVVTEEHPCLALRPDGRFAYVRADRLETGDRLLVPLGRSARRPGWRAARTALFESLADGFSARPDAGLRSVLAERGAGFVDGWIPVREVLERLPPGRGPSFASAHTVSVRAGQCAVPFPRRREEMRRFFRFMGSARSDPLALPASSGPPRFLQVADEELTAEYVAGAFVAAEGGAGFRHRGNGEQAAWLALLLPRVGILPEWRHGSLHISSADGRLLGLGRGAAMGGLRPTGEGLVLLEERRYLGDSVGLARVTGKDRVPGPCTVYDFTVEKNHNFVANCMVAHNTSLLDEIRGTAVQVREAGGITQHIGASFFPPETLAEICGPLVGLFGGQVRIPGILVIDTPGHEAFANLRSRGGSAADIAILVVDITKGLEPQSFESIEILRSRKVPFLVALNKVDLLPGWRPKHGRLVKQAASELEKVTVDRLDDAIYRVVGQLSTLGFSSEAYYRVKDFTKEVSIVPVSAETGEGIPELLALLVGLTQQHMAQKLVAGKGTKGIVLEVKEEPGLGATANVILTDGVLRVGSRVAVAKRDGAEILKVRALLMPKPLDEMRDPRDRFEPVQGVRAAAGVKVTAPSLDGVLAGSPLLGLDDGMNESEARA